MCKEIELKIIGRKDSSIDKDAKHFLVKGKVIENIDGLYTADDYITTTKDILVDYLHIFDQSERHYYI